jgi:hypothetical protein
MAVNRVDHPSGPGDQPSGEREHDDGGKNDMPTLNMPAFLHDDRPPTVRGITHPLVEWSRVLNSGQTPREILGGKGPRIVFGLPTLRL